MAISYNSGVLKSSDITATTSDASVGQRPDRRRIFNFGDRVAELVPEESPFFVYLNQVSKSPTDDPVFRYLENRNRISFTDRSFLLAADVWDRLQRSGLECCGVINWSPYHRAVSLAPLKSSRGAGAVVIGA